MVSSVGAFFSGCVLSVTPLRAVDHLNRAFAKRHQKNISASQLSLTLYAVVS